MAAVPYSGAANRGRADISEMSGEARFGFVGVSADENPTFLFRAAQPAAKIRIGGLFRQHFVLEGVFIGSTSRSLLR